MFKLSKYLLPITLAILLAGCQGSRHGTGPLNTENKTALRIYNKIPHYKKLSQGGWHLITVTHLPLKVGNTSTAVAEIRNRLIQLGDLTASDASTSDHFDSNLARGVRQYQWRHGLKMDGSIGEKTLQSLNISPEERLEQLKTAMDRFAEFPGGVGSRYIHVNVANFELNLIENGEKIINMKVIAGKPARPTPELYSKIQTIVLNPKWNIPRKIAQKDIIPKIIANPNYLTEENISIYSSWEKDAYKIDPVLIDWEHAANKNFPYRFSQSPGNFNALGRVKFVFLNTEDVYLHDTPQKGLFAKIQRAFSSGCVRLEKPFELVEYFIQASPTLSHEEVFEKLNTGETKYVRIKNPIPIYITYITAWVDKNGYSHFREDIYKRNEFDTTEEI